jgi:cytosine/uracil/thiamine/allantoin permease
MLLIFDKVRRYLHLIPGGFLVQSKKERESTIAQRKRTNNDLQNTKQKTKDRATQNIATHNRTKRNDT